MQSGLQEFSFQYADSAAALCSTFLKPGGTGYGLLTIT